MATQTFKGAVRPRANYPLARRAGDFIYVSGTSSRRPDNTFVGAEADELGTTRLDIRAQTEAVLTNIGRTLAAAGAGLEDLCEVTCFLANINDFGGFNEVYNRVFSEDGGPTRTTVAVHQLPHPHILIEIKGVAYKPL